MRFSILASFGGDYPLLRFEVDFAPTHCRHFTATLGGCQQHWDELAERISFVSAGPKQTDYLIVI